MKEKLIRDLYENRGYDKGNTDEAVRYIKEMELFLKKSKIVIDDAPLKDVREYLAELVSSGENTAVRLLALARYFNAVDNHSIYIYFTKLFGGYGVMDNIKKRLIFQAGKEIQVKIFDGLIEPVLGSPPEVYPEFTNEFMKRLKLYLSPAQYRLVLAGNNHGIPMTAMQAEKYLYEQSDSIDEYLKGRHERNVAEIQKHFEEGKVWYEQEITREIVDYVKSNQEILSAVRRGNKLYVTKIPFDGINYLAAEDPVLKNYYACHCPFARERIIDEAHPNVDSDWCYCSAGFAKYPFEIIFGEELEVELLQSALKGDPVCRFAITLPPGLK